MKKNKIKRGDNIHKMKKLKTLKDLEIESHFETYADFVFIDELRAEAIKWVKEYHFPPFGTFCEFFNISEEELKGGVK